MKVEECIHNFSKNIKVIREGLGISQAAMGQKCNVSRETVNGWENGKFLPRIETLLNIGKQFNIDPINLLTDELQIEVKIVASKKE